MPSTRLTIKNNTNRSHATVVILDLSLGRSPVLVAAKNKLRLNKASNVYSSSGKALIFPREFSSLSNGDIVFISCGEAFVGAVMEAAEEARGPHAAVKLVANLAPVEPEAIAQLNSMAKLEGMRLVVGMPDLHPGQSGPIGAVYVSTGFVYPKLIGTLSISSSGLKCMLIIEHRW